MGFHKCSIIRLINVLMVVWDVSIQVFTVVILQMMVIFWVIMPRGAFGTNKPKFSQPKDDPQKHQNKQNTMEGVKTKNAAQFFIWNSKPQKDATVTIHIMFKLLPFFFRCHFGFMCNER